MNASTLSTWLREHGYARGAHSINRAAFLCDANAALESLSAPEIAAHDLNNWLNSERGPVAQIAGRTFDDFLEYVLRQKSEPVARVYRVEFHADEATAQALEEIAAGGTGRVEDFLRTTLLAAVEDEIQIHRAARRSRKR